ncbi:hypothetical protein PIB30_096920, partial [Stylosanthes scabra]|nr:hypothetical protein [Stylosanthes scabra]
VAFHAYAWALYAYAWVLKLGEESGSRWRMSKRELERELSLNRVAFQAYAWAFHAYAWMDDERRHAKKLVGMGSA